MRNYLEFEKEIKSLEQDLENSKNPFDKDGISQVDTKKIKKIEEDMCKKLLANLVIENYKIIETQ